VTISRHDQPARTQVAVEAAALAVAAADIVAQIIAGVKYGAVPPGLIILLAAAAVVWFVPWRWTPMIGVVCGAFIFIGGFAAAQGRDDLSHPGAHPGAFAGTLIQMIAMAVAVVVGVLALVARSRRADAAVAQ
jgi:uncharacterized membrane protein